MSKNIYLCFDESITSDDFHHKLTEGMRGGVIVMTLKQFEDICPSNREIKISVLFNHELKLSELEGK